MLSILVDRTYRHLFLAQVIALLGTGLATAALGLLAYDIAGVNAGAVLGTALAIKMLAHVGVAPVAAAFAERLPRRAILVVLDLAVAAACSMVIVNTVALVQGQFGLAPRETALALAAFGAGPVVAALSLPQLLNIIPDRMAMLGEAITLTAGLLLGAWVDSFWPLLALWLVFGVGYSIVQASTSRLLRRSSHPEDRPALFAAQFALSHACWLAWRLLRAECHLFILCRAIGRGCDASCYLASARP